MQQKSLAREIPHSIWPDITKEITAVKSRFDLQVKIAIVGFGKAGKSTLFNTIFGENIQETGAQTDLTKKERRETRFGAIFTDTRGFGTEVVPLEEIKRILEDQHLILHCINGMSAIAAEDLDLYRFCKSSGKPVIICITKTDVMKDREIREYRASVTQKLSSSADPIFVSAETGSNMELLSSRIVRLLPEAVRNAFIAKQRVSLGLKREDAKILIHATAIGAAGVAISPIPLSDVIVLVPIQAGMVVGIAKIYGYEISTERAKEILFVAGSGVVLRYTFQTLVKFLPGVGSLIGPAIAYGGTVAIGEAAIRYFESGMRASADEIADVYKRAKEIAERDFDRKGIEKSLTQLPSGT
ncbi:MAG: GTPase [Desulfomonilaceae bacterium]